MPKAFPREFRSNVVAVARKDEAPLSQVAKDFGVSESCLHRWLSLADIEDGRRPGVTAAESAELRELKKTQPAAGAGEQDLAPGRCLPVSGYQPKACTRWSVSWPLTRSLSRCPAGCSVSPNRRTSMARPPGVATGPGRRAPDQRSALDPPRRPGVRFPVHRRRARRPWHHRFGEPHPTAVFQAADLVGVRAPARNRHLDRNDLPPPAPATSIRQPDPDRV
jgi:transposase